MMAKLLIGNNRGRVDIGPAKRLYDPMQDRFPKYFEKPYRTGRYRRQRSSGLLMRFLTEFINRGLS